MTHGRTRDRPWWNFLDVINKAVFVATTAGYIYFWYILDDFKSNITDLNQETDFSQIEVLGSRWVLLFNTVAVNIIISTFTVFKFLNVNPRMSMMWKTLEKATPDLVAFLVFFSIIFFTFVATGYMMFGTQLDNFRTFTKATFACFNMLVRDVLAATCVRAQLMYSRVASAAHSSATFNTT